MKILIDSKWIDRDDKIGVYDPFDNSLIDYIPKANREDVSNVLNAAEKGCKIAKNLTIYERSQILYKTADILTNRTEEFAQLLARESSKTIREARKFRNRHINASGR
jgi:acyl-CoA reductase-like NAD-dependent aldehyde dehydrogenase